MSLQEVINPKTGRPERILVDLSAVYPDAEEELTFEEIMAKRRGWLDQKWPREIKAEEPSQEISQDIDHSQEHEASSREISQDVAPDMPLNDQTLSDVTESKDLYAKESKPRRKKVLEVKGETQTSISLRIMRYYRH